METKNLLIVLAIGVLFTGIVFISGCAEFLSHTECNDEGKCIEVEGFAMGECVDDSDCETPTETHMVCDFTKELCIEVEGAGDDECETDEDCVSNVTETHMECSNDSVLPECIEVEGAGDDECETDEDCFVENYLVCSDGACIEMEGTGEDECAVDEDCTHLECVDEVCTLINEPGEDTCTTDEDCAPA